MTAKRRNRGGDSSSVSNLYKRKNAKKARPEIHQGTRSNAFPRFFRDRLSHYHKRARAWSYMYGRSSDPCGGSTPAACITFFIRYRNYLIPRASESVGGALLQPAVASVRARPRAPLHLLVCHGSCRCAHRRVYVYLRLCTLCARAEATPETRISERSSACVVQVRLCVNVRGVEVERKMCGGDVCATRVPLYVRAVSTGDPVS